MSIVLSTEQREQAGSDSYNRFEYQTHWIVCHIIDQLNTNPKCIIFCEYHDDMAKLIEGEDSSFEFYQIKTKGKSDDWSIVELSEKAKRKDGTYKKSFLGFIFYNFMKFGDECSCCHFVSNNSYDTDVKLWQAYIEDEKKLKDENLILYNTIKDRIQKEYATELPANFDSIFDKFVQKTFIYSSELQLTTFTDQVSGKFFSQLADKKIPTNTANLILQQIINDVRKKSQIKLSPPISFKSLVDKKGIRLHDINEKLSKEVGADGNYSEFSNFLKSIPLKDKDIARLIQAKTLHDTRWLDIEDIKYQEIILLLRKQINDYILADANAGDIGKLIFLCEGELQKRGLSSSSLDESLVEVMYYEQLFKRTK